MPSYFFHIKVDLVRSASNIQDILYRDKKLINHIKGAPRQVTGQTLTGKLSRVSLEPSIPSKSNPNATSVHSTDSGHIGDWRQGTIKYQIVEMLSPPSEGSSSGSIRTGLQSIYPGAATKARFEPIGKDEEELGYGIVRLYRDAEETSGLYDLPTNTKPSKSAKKHPSKKHAAIQEKTPAFRDEECTTLCILTVPSWWDVARLIAFVGEEARDNVSHFRMIRTEPNEQYMLLMKFRNGKTAREWRKAWNGKVFDPAAPTEYCRVIFVMSVEICELDDETNNHDTSNDLSESSTTGKEVVKQLPSIASLGPKPMPPPTRPLIEMPTCPVCLERMDETSGLLTIPCQHTFHCVCLVKWRKNGCPVCRFTRTDATRRGSDPNEDDDPDECNVCRSNKNIWICLICGNLGCGRYDAGHAMQHFKETNHAYALDMKDQSIWNYSSDTYEHRIMQNKVDGKMMELPSAAGDYNNLDEDDDDVVPRSKLDAMGAEYTQLLMSQLGSQRSYYEQKLEAAADRASAAAKAAEKAKDDVEKVVQELSLLQISHNRLVDETIPALEKERNRFEQRSLRSEERSQNMERSWQIEKSQAAGLREKLAHQDKQYQKSNKDLEDALARIEELEDTNHDLMANISGQNKLQSLDQIDLEGSTVFVLGKQGENKEDAKPEKKKRKKPKKHGKGSRGEALAALSQGKISTSGENSKTASEVEEDEVKSTDKGKQKAVVQPHSATVSDDDE